MERGLGRVGLLQGKVASHDFRYILGEVLNKIGQVGPFTVVQVGHISNVPYFRVVNSFYYVNYFQCPKILLPVFTNSILPKQLYALVFVDE